jgi:hypothetical protein
MITLFRPKAEKKEKVTEVINRQTFIHTGAHPEILFGAPGRASKAPRIGCGEGVKKNWYTIAKDVFWWILSY